MKRVIVFFFAVCAMAAGARAQQWTPTGGILGALNFSKFSASGNDVVGTNFTSGTGGAGGIWVNFPLGRVVSLEPQLLYSSYAYNIATTTVPAYSASGSIGYISIPVLFKFHVLPFLAITAGPELDFKTSVSSFGSLNTKSSDFTGTSFSLSGGLEVFPQGRVVVFGRYIGGLTNMNNVSASDAKLYNENFQVGLKLRLFGHKIIPPAAAAPVVAPPPPPPVDSDGDGITDVNDKCPNTPGVAKYSGCPIPDTDGDGINDELDKCPTVAGIAKYNGCPIPDTDGDGINDEEDRCPLTPGISSNFGCPEMIFHYLRSDAELSADDKADLDKVVTFMNKNPDIHIIIEGYTSNTGTAAYNLTLSQKRAENSMNYLVSKGVDAARMKAIGYGLTNPVGDNATAEGRAANRRVVMKIDKP
jgi:hypothetical protein